MGAGGNGADALLCPQEIRKVVQALEQTAREILTLLQGVHQGGGFQHSECPPHPPHPLPPLPQAAALPARRALREGERPGVPVGAGRSPSAVSSRGGFAMFRSRDLCLTQCVLLFSFFFLLSQGGSWSWDLQALRRDARQLNWQKGEHSASHSSAIRDNKCTLSRPSVNSR